MSDDEQSSGYYQRWDPDEHAELIGSWYRARGMSDDAGELSTYPPTGFVVDGIMAGFVYITNSSVAIFDQWVSDPNSTEEARRAAIDVLFELLCDCAREHGALVVWMTSPVQSVMVQSGEHGFQLQPQPYMFSFRSL